MTTIAVSGFPTGIAITSDGLYAYVLTNYVPNSKPRINVIDTTSNMVTSVINLEMFSNTTVFNRIAITTAKIPIPTKEDTSLIIGLSCGGVGLITLLGVGGFLAARWLKKEEEKSQESNSLISPLSVQQKMVYL